MDELDVGKLRIELGRAQGDSGRALIMSKLAEAYRGEFGDSTRYYGEGALRLSRKIHYPIGEAKALCILCFYHYTKGDLPTGMEFGLNALSVARNYNLVSEQACALIRIGNIYMILGNYSEALRFLRVAREITQDDSYKFYHAVTYWRAADAFMSLNLTDSALYYGRIAMQLARELNNRFIASGVAPAMGTAYAEKGNDTLAMQYFRMSGSGLGRLAVAEYFVKRKLVDSALLYAQRSFELASEGNVIQVKMKAADLLSTLYEPTDLRKALQFKNIAGAVRDSLYSAEKITAATAVTFREKEHESRLLLDQTEFRSKVKVYVTLVGLLAVLLVALLLYRSILRERNSNALLIAQKNEIARTLADLKAAQSQLIQSEKMASLGELTAGIAHEIQNPLNFVNNFSEVNVELSDELEDAAKKGDLDEVRALAGDIRSNQERIREHGQRADAIVKSMLQHSRASTGQKEPTDLAALADEYLKLSYHGMRAKDKEFNVILETDFDPDLPKIDLVPQDIGRVLLNLYNNAFHAVMERKKSGEEGYEPKVRVEVRGAAVDPRSSILDPRFVSLRVTDNGPGITDAIRDKVFQPFFTTKPTGQGTGLGLSLSYDIVTKGHGGLLTMESEVGSSASFTILLPV